MNYITAIDDEIARLRQRIAELETARSVIATLQAQPASPAAKPKKRQTRGAIHSARTVALAWLDKQPVPVPSRDIIAALAHLKLSDSTVWKALKDMRDEGLIIWDETTRFYSVVRAAEKVAS